jgi:hypothetical protein
MIAIARPRHYQRVLVQRSVEAVASSASGVWNLARLPWRGYDVRIMEIPPSILQYTRDLYGKRY